ncbi:unnamed protein product [Polarella glacialis]|uniref:Uncharacterized protein n=1 Tax=Polarella glacialis TaxID=89957 RepID=A0A813ETU2_POLGL|nr:unnamed protein product [Polarella glacialis]
MQGLKDLKDSGAEHLKLSDLLAETELGRVVLELACTDLQQQACKQVIDQIVQGALQPEFRPMQVYESGSFKRGTALCYDFDVDLVLTLCDFDYRQIEKYIHRSKAALVKKFGDGVEFTRAPTGRCLKFEVRGCFRFDLLFTGHPARNWHGNPEEFYTPAGSHEVDKLLIAAKGTHPVFHPLVLVAKHWKNQHQGERRLKSYYVELLCLRTINEQRGPGLTLKAAFKAFLTEFTTGRLVVQNPNRYSPGPLSPSKHSMEEFVVYAEKTLRSLYGSKFNNNNSNHNRIQSPESKMWQTGSFKTHDEAIFDFPRKSSQVDDDDEDNLPGLFLAIGVFIFLLCQK